jgi:hypothetical protein
VQRRGVDGGAAVVEQRVGVVAEQLLEAWSGEHVGGS